MEVCQRTFFLKFFIADRQRRLLKRASSLGASASPCVLRSLMYTQQAHVIFRPPRTLVRLATPLLLRRERRRSTRRHTRQRR